MPVYPLLLRRLGRCCWKGSILYDVMCVGGGGRHPGVWWRGGDVAARRRGWFVPEERARGWLSGGGGERQQASLGVSRRQPWWTGLPGTPDVTSKLHSRHVKTGDDLYGRQKKTVYQTGK